jgi:AcrR family transcriptional regulator
MTVVSLARRKPNPRRRSAEIIDAAARVFAERGFHGASTQDIADVLGIRQASLYYYFSSKEQALELVCLKGVDGFVEAAAAVAATSATPAEKLRRLITSHLTPLLDRADYVRVFLNERQHLPHDSRRRIGKQSRALERIYESVLKEGVASGQFRADLDVRLTALAVLGMCNAAPAWYGKEANASIERIVDGFARLALEGATRPRGPRSRRGGRWPLA